MKKLWTLLLLAVFCFSPVLAEEACQVLYPSEAERRIVDGRDFYVVAAVPEDAASATVRLIDEAGKTVRELTGNDRPEFYLDYPTLNAFNTEQAEYFMPDLIYEPDRPDSLYDGSIKCYLKDGLLFAVVPGGYYQMDGRAIVDHAGVPYAKLTAGEYTLEIEAGGARSQITLTLGATQSKVMARFSPSGHLASVTDAANKDALRAYFDPLPGYWSPSSFLPAQKDNPYFAEIKERWQLADAMEYAAGTVNFYVYNLTANCATIAVELATLQLDNAVDTRMRAYYYDIGEPLLPYRDVDSDIYLMGAFTPFAPGDILALTRAETTDEAKENFYVAYAEDARPIDLDMADGLTVPAGKALTLFGVLRPIQNEASDLKQLSATAWEIGNRVTSIAYEFVCGEETWSQRRDVGLTRELAEGWEAYSIYEFAHSFVFPDTLAGKTVTATLTGYDAHGAVVAGTNEALTIAVTQ